MPARGEEAESFISDRYALRFEQDRPYVALFGANGRSIADLFSAAGVHSTGGLDDSSALGAWSRAERGHEVVYSLDLSSSIWDRKTVRFRCLPDRLQYEVTVSGSGSLTDVTYFGGYTSAIPRWGSGFFLSGHAFTRLFNPEPNTADVYNLSPESGSVIDLTGAPLPGKRHWFFNPPPFCYSAESSAGWVGLGVAAAKGQYRFSEYRWHGGAGFWLSLAYDGRTRLDGSYDLPAISIDFAADAPAALAAHCDGLRRAGLAPQMHRPKPDWWSRPMFCGWGAQCARAADVWGRAGGDQFLDSLAHAATHARQREYDGFLAALSQHGVYPGTVVIDDKWQSAYGTNEADPDKWPDLPGFVARRHADGQHVLLWLKAWDREGVPNEECIQNGSGLPLTVDPTNPRFEERLRKAVRRMLSPGGYDADGFKIDFTHRIPVGPGLRSHGDASGLELLKRYLGILYDEAKSAKSDALIVTHTPHPYLADVTDMIRLNDMLDLTRLDDPHAGKDIRRTVTQRAAVARIACPDALIDTDNWPVRNRATWREYVRLQPSVGVPSLYFATHIDLTGEPLEAADYQLLREEWNGIDNTSPVGAG
jgi:hypothetical protein